MKGKYTIRAVSQLTSLSEHLIRAWERRYQAVTPTRTNGNQRRYSEADLKRLQLLSQLVNAGTPIGRAARLSNQELEEQVLKFQQPSDLDTDAGFLDSAIQAVEAMEQHTLAEVIAQASISYGKIGSIDKLIEPLMYWIGDTWHKDSLRIVHEHMATEVIRTFLGSALSSYGKGELDRGIVVAPASGQTHELGAMACAVTAASMGFRVSYLGVGSPPEETIAAVTQTQSLALVLSVVFPKSLAQAREELQFLKEYLPKDVQLLVGGSSASRLDSSYSTGNIAELKQQLSLLWSN